MREENTQSGTMVTLLLFLGITVLFGADVVSDLLAGSSYTHVGVEAWILAMATVGTLRILVHNHGLRRQARRLNVDLARTKAEAEQWRNEAKEALAGLGAAVDRQFERWQLTRAESEVGLLLLKGLSLKEIASLRAVSERTVRDQARAVYRKGQLEGRADLAAYFLEDLLLPSATGAAPGAERPADEAAVTVIS